MKHCPKCGAELWQENDTWTCHGCHLTELAWLREYQLGTWHSLGVGEFQREQFCRERDSAVKLFMGDHVIEFVVTKDMLPTTMDLRDPDTGNLLARFVNIGELEKKR